MAKLKDLLDQTEAKVDAAAARVTADETVDQQTITDLRAEVARLQAIVDAGEATPEQEAQLAAIQAKLDAVEQAQA
jgi:hypothetical protein